MQRDWKTTKANLDPKERILLRDLAAEVAQRWPEPVIVHIGVYHSGSMYCSHAGAPEAQQVGIDIRKVYRPKGELGAKFILGRSQDSHQGFDGPIHLLFVDGDHHYEAAMSDLINWGAKVASGGVMAIHDYYGLGELESRCPGKPGLAHLAEVKQAVDDWETEYGQQWVRSPVVRRTVVFRRR